ncbi:glycosyl transferase, WecB/TagA/CpsF [Arthrobacter sp. Hiyo4]|nr:glycosyl transferase, WecB/TagA/CpsF [Arthrobacter sp. Hiyo4]
MSLVRQDIPVLGVDATPLKVDDLLEVLAGFVADGTKRTVVGHNLHSVTLTHSDAGFRSVYDESDVVLLDGAPVLWLWGRTGNAVGRSWSTGWVPRTGCRPWAGLPA